MLAGLWLAEGSGEIEFLRLRLIIEVQMDAIGEAGLGEEIKEAGARARAGAIMKLEIRADRGETLRHRHHRGDADAASQQNGLLRGLEQREIVAWRADFDHPAFGEILMNPLRPAARSRIAQNAEQIAMGLARRIGQRILADQPGGDLDINMRAGVKAGQRRAIGGLQFQCDNPLGLVRAAGDLGFDGFVIAGHLFLSVVLPQPRA